MGDATDTPIHKAIQNITGMYPVPAYGNLRALGAMTQYGDIRPAYAARVISGLEQNFVRKRQQGLASGSLLFLGCKVRSLVALAKAAWKEWQERCLSN